jgi:hypothetical protein
MSFNAKFTDNEGFLYHAQIRSANAIEHSDTGSSTITTALRDELALASVNTHKYDVTTNNCYVCVNTANGSFTNAVEIRLPNASVDGRYIHM